MQNNIIKIPGQLKEVGFCRVESKGKKAFEKEWPQKPYSYEEIQKYFPQENYGVICGYKGVAVVDCDDYELREIIETKLPKTFTVRTGKGGMHFYYFIPELKKKLVLNNEIGHLGEVQSHGAQAVGPGSTHPIGNKYEIDDDTEIQTISLEKLMNAVKPFIKKEVDYVKIERSLSPESEIDKLSVTDIWGVAKMRQQGGEFYGSHPIHGSSTGENFWINPDKNTWHCFRCDSGGGPLAAIAVKEGIIDCSDAVPGGLRGSKAKEAIQIAEEKYGLKKSPKISYQEPPSIEELEAAFTPLESFGVENVQNKNQDAVDFSKELSEHTHCSEDIEKMEQKEKPWVVDRIIEENELNEITASTGIGKSLIMLKMMLDVSNGNKFLNEFKTKKKKVLIFDLEMSKNENIVRMKSLSGGNKNLFVTIEKRIDIEKNYEGIKKYIQDGGFELVVFDPLALLIPAGKKEKDGDDMKDVMMLFKQLMWETKITIIFLHHHGKNTEYSGTDKSRNVTQIVDYIVSHISIDKVGPIIRMGREIGSTIRVSQGKGRGMEKMKTFTVEITGVPGRKSTFVRVENKEKEDVKWARTLEENMEIGQGYTKLDLVDIISQKKEIKNLKTTDRRFYTAVNLLLEDERFSMILYSQWLAKNNYQLFVEKDGKQIETSTSSNIYLKEEYKDY